MAEKKPTKKKQAEAAPVEETVVEATADDATAEEPVKAEKKPARKKKTEAAPVEEPVADPCDVVVPRATVVPVSPRTAFGFELEQAAAPSSTPTTTP